MTQDDGHEQPHLRLVPGDQDPEETTQSRGEPEASGHDRQESTSTPVRRSGLRWPQWGWRRWTLAALLVALGGWWVVAHAVTPASYHAPPAAPPAASQAPQVDSAIKTATRYETAIQSGDPKTACALDADPRLCEVGFGSEPVKLRLVEPVSVVQATPVVTSPNASGAQTRGVGVLVQWQAEGQNRLRSAVLVDDSTGKVVKRVTIGSTNASTPLESLLGGALP